MRKKRKAPLRLCLACGEKKDKRELIRIVKTPQGEILLDETGKQSGRGSYICINSTCLNAALKSKKLEKSLRKSIPQEAIEKIRTSLDEKYQ